jgi:hypothetical protein
MSEDTVELVQRGIEAFNRRDFDAALAAVTDDITWERYLSRTESEEPAVRGKEELRATWVSQVEAVDLRLEPLELIPVGAEKVVVPTRMVAHAGGSDTPIEAEVTWVFSARDGLLHTVEAFDGRETAIAAARL